MNITRKTRQPMPLPSSGKVAACSMNGVGRKTRQLMTVGRRLAERDPQNGGIKCNVDVSFSIADNKVEIGICLRDSTRNFIGAQTH